MVATGQHFLYQQVAEDMGNAIGMGTYAPGERLPSLRRIAAHYEVSLATAILAEARRPDVINLGAAIPGPELLPLKSLSRTYAGVRVHPDEIIITNGCMEALLPSLRALCKAGDTVAIESPSYYGMMQAAE